MDYMKRVKNMVIQNSAINFKFPRVENVKRKYILNQDILKEKFNEANILPIPDDAPSEIPRILISSKGEHSQVSIAPEAITIQTTYSDEYLTNWEKCSEYMKTRANDIYSLTDKLTDNYDYIGVVTNLIWNDIQEKGNQVLFSNIFGKCAAENLDDLVVKYTYVENEKYYVNITIQSVRIFKQADPNAAGMFTDDNLQTHTVSIMLDVNDRYAFNRTKGYNSTKENFEEIMALTTNIINNKLKCLVEKGEY